MISPQKLVYNNFDINEYLNQLTVILDVAFDSDNGEMSSFLNRSAVASESFDGRYKNTIRYKYDELFSPRFTIVKKDFSDFSQSEVRQVLKFLTQTDKPAMLEVSYDKEHENIVSEDRDFCAIGGFTTIDTYKLANNRTVGILATFEAITPFAMSKLYTMPIDASTNYKATIEIDTDDNQPVYPRITIQEKGTIVQYGAPLDFYSDMVPNTTYKYGNTFYWKSDVPSLVAQKVKPSYDWPQVNRDTIYTETDEIKEDTIYYYTSDQAYRWIDPYTFKSSSEDPKLATTSVKITNQHHDLVGLPSKAVSMTIKNNTATEKIIVDGVNRVISSTNTKRIFGDDFVGWQWLPLRDGKNEITVEGNCSVVLEWREIRKFGEW